MNIKSLHIVVLFFLCMNFSYGQNVHFIKAGSIQYDKTLYLKNIIKRKFLETVEPSKRSHFEKLQQNIPESVVVKKELVFNSEETLYGPSSSLNTDTKTKEVLFGTFSDYDGISYHNLTTREYRKLNDVMGEKSLIQGKMDTITWKITDEYREIAGYKCRRANGLTKDSIYLIAFYSPEIPISSGPESVNGVPGMILGLVIPDLHSSYFATEVKGFNKTQVDKSRLFTTKLKPVSKSQLKQGFIDNFQQFFNKDIITYIIQVAIL